MFHNTASAGLKCQGLLNSLSWIPSSWTFSAAPCCFPPTTACVLGSFFPIALLVPVKAGTFSFEGIGSVATGQTVGTDIISFTAAFHFLHTSKPPIEKFQITGLFMSCALDHWIHASWGILFSTLPPVSSLWLICMQVRFHYHWIYFTDSSLFCSYSFRIHFLPTFVYLESQSLGKGAM